MSSESSTVVKRTVRRSTVSGTGHGGSTGDLDDVHTRRYQVYRGMSPNTANRLEVRIRELEDALEQERQFRVRIELELQEYSSEYDSMAERLEEADGQSSAAGEAGRRYAAENAKLRKDLELLTVQYESAEASLRKRHLAEIAELAAQIEQLTKYKNKSEKERQHFVIEIETLSSGLDGANKARIHAEARLDSLEEQLRRAKLQVEELTHLNNDLNSWKARLTQENLDLHRQVQ
jgi:chromosome segregation ATPase